jgi:hypothetical protein
LLGIPSGFADGVDNDTTYSNGAGLSLTGTVFSVNFGGTGAANTAARSDHNHDAAYVNEGQSLSISNGMLQNDAITTAKIYDNSVTSAKINDGTIQTIDIGALAVTNARLSADAVTSAKIQDGTVTAADLADGSGSGIDADLLDGQHGSSFQARVSGTCVPGSTIRTIAVDGTVSCQDDAPLLRSQMPAAASRVNLVGSGVAGIEGPYSSLSIGPDGLPYVAYTSTVNNQVSLLVCTDWACSGHTHLVSPMPADGGNWPSLVFSPDGRPLVAFVGGSRVRLLICGSLTCASWSVKEIDVTANAQHTAMVLGADGYPLISYNDTLTGTLRVAHCTTIDCSGATQITTLDTGNTGYWTDITLGGDGLGLVVYEDISNRLRVAHCSSLACTTATLNTLTTAAGPGFRAAITTGIDGLGLISYRFNNMGGSAALKTTHCSNVLCSSFVTATHDSADDSGDYSSITIGADGLGIIAYQNATFGNLLVAHCTDLACSGSTISSIAYVLDEGYHSSISITPDGLPVMTYYDNTNKDIWFARCSNALCVPYFRRR